jgi:hypothetical protein
MRSNWMVMAGLMLAGLASGVLPKPSSLPAGTHDQVNHERTTLPMQANTLPSGLEIPPLDAAVPAQTETATFALG